MDEAQPTTSARRLGGGLISFIILAAIIALFFAYQQRAATLYHHPPGFPVAIRHLPYYAFCSFYRMLAAYILALIFSIVYGMAAGSGGVWERVLIPVVDIAQSVPVVGFFPAAIFFFVALAHGRLGVEMAVIFLIFTSQSWNMTLGIYESVKTIPGESAEALEAFGVSGWLRFKHLLMPTCVPKLVYNSILSWVSGWYYLTACEIITVGSANYRLPGIGSFLMEAADHGRGVDIVGGLLTLLAVIVLMDAIVWQPLTIWSEKFRYEFSATSGPAHSLGMLDVLGGIGPTVLRALRTILTPPWRAGGRLLDAISRAPVASNPITKRTTNLLRIFIIASLVVFSTWAVGAGLFALVRALLKPWPSNAKEIPVATLASLVRLIIAYAISLAWTLPCALAASESPRFNRILAPVAEIAGAIPATALFPLIVLLVIRITGGMNLASILLTLTGMQWYLLFNLLAGVNQVPEDLKEAARAFGLSRFATWRKLVVPALMPSLITGSLTAWGGGWNALILSEYFPYQGQVYQVTGLGALLDEATYKTGNSTMILLSLLSMVLVVIMLNRLVWRRLYNTATERYRLDY
ncbi:MAG: ABC transporter permease subunit [Candidatus Binataceae bacterium]